MFWLAPSIFRANIKKDALSNIGMTKASTALAAWFLKNPGDCLFNSSTTMQIVEKTLPQWASA